MVGDNNKVTEKEITQAFPGNTAEDTENLDDGPDGDTDEEEDDNFVDLGKHEGQTFEDAMRDQIRTLRDFLDGLEYQI